MKYAFLKITQNKDSVFVQKWLAFAFRFMWRFKSLQDDYHLIFHIYFWRYGWEGFKKNLKNLADSSEKTLMLGNIEGRRGRGWQRMRWLDGITDTTDMGLGGLREFVTDREAWRAVHGIAKSLTRLSDWTELKKLKLINKITNVR